MLGLILSSILILATSCSKSNHSDKDGAPDVFVKAILAPNPIPKKERISKFGNKKTYHVKGKTYHVLRTAKNYQKIGIASWYGTKFHGRLTSSREPYNMFALTAASKELPIPCYVKVKNLDNNKSAIVRVNDRGPFKPGRIMDLSYAAAQKLDMMKKGTARVEISYIEPKSYQDKQKSLKLHTVVLKHLNNQNEANKFLKKIRAYSEFRNSYIIKKSDKYIITVGPLSLKKSIHAIKIAKKLHIKATLS